MTAVSPRHHRWEGDSILLPLEGVLLDLTAAHRAVWRWWATTVGADPEAVASLAEGRHAGDVVEEIAPWIDREHELARLHERESLLVRTMRRRRGSGGLLRAVPPTRRALRSVTSGEQLAERRRRARIDEPIAVTADQIPVGPPAPDAHQAMLEAVGSPASQCLALEATAAGTAAAIAAGLPVVFVAGGIDREVPAGVQAVIHAPSTLRVELTVSGLSLTFREESARGW